MLFSKAIADLTHEDVEEFCKRFREGLRVEYKSTFDASVKKKLSRVVSSFANSYGGILVVGINASNGIPQEPFDGIEFEDREPRLTVENICRADIFPETVVYQSLVPSRIQGKAFLVVQVNESPKAPHAIENSTLVYIRTGDSANPTTLANVAIIERFLLRRQELLARWEEFYEESKDFARKLLEQKSDPVLDVRIGPVYPTDVVIAREKVFDFLSDYQLQRSSGFQADSVSRHPNGAMLLRKERAARYLNIGEFGTVHYVESLESTRLEARHFSDGSELELVVYPFWWLVSPVLKVLGVAAALIESHAVTCNLRIEATLANVFGHDFYLPFGEYYGLQSEAGSSVAAKIPASTHCSSDLLSSRKVDLATELLYQLRWPLGSDQPHTREAIKSIVESTLRSLRAIS